MDKLTRWEYITSALALLLYSLWANYEYNKDPNTIPYEPIIAAILTLCGIWGYVYYQNDKAEKAATTTIQNAEKIYDIETIKEANFDNRAIKTNIENQYINYGDKKIPRFLTAPPFNSDYFIGRDDDLKAIETDYQTNNRLLFLVNGEGGMGKTTLVSKYWYAHQERYKHLAWLYVDRGIGAALISLAAQLQINFDPNDDEKQQIARITEGVNNLEMPCLLVFDNANDADDLMAQYTTLRKLSQCHILLTSRTRGIEGMKVHRVLPLTQENAVAVFKHYYKKLSDTEEPLLHDILKAVGYNTLVIEVLAKNLAVFNKYQTQYSLTDLLTDLQEKGLLSLKNKAVKVVYGSDTLLTAEPTDIIAAMYDLATLTDSEQYLLSNLAVLPAENIPFAVLSDLLKPTQSEALEDPLSILEEKGWIEYREADSSFKISPVIQEITKVKNAERLLADCATLIDTLSNGLSNEIIHLDNYKQATAYAYWGKAVAFAIPFADVVTVVLCQNIGGFYKDTGNLSLMMQAFQKMVDIQTNLFQAEPDNADFKNWLAISYEKLGDTHNSLGNLDKALGFFEARSKLGEELYTDYHNNLDFKNGLATSYSKLGETHSSLGNLDKALDYFEKEIELAKALYADYPNNVDFKKGLAISYEKLGETHSSLGNLEKSLVFFKEFTKLIKDLYADYPNNVDFKNGLAISYEKLGTTHSSLGNLDTALGFFEEHNKLVKDLHGAYPNNVNFKNNLAISYSKLGATHSSLGNLDTALGFFEEQNKLIKELHRDYSNNVFFKNGLAISYQFLGDTHSSLGNLDKALGFFEDCNRLEKDLYTAYPTNVEFKNGLAVSFYKLGEFSRDKLKDKTKAKSYFKQAETLWLELVRDAPQYVQYQKFLGQVQEILSDL